MSKTAASPSPETALHDAGEHVSEEMVQFVSFLVEDEEYMIDIRLVREIIKKVKITTLPKSSSFIEGILDLRGAIIPIVNLRRKLGLLKADMQGKEGNIVIVENKGKFIGLIVDAVREVVRVKAKQIELKPTIARAEREYVSGICQYGDRLLILLAIDRLFSADEMEMFANL
ncbi:chemotaxis protein CheW [Chrysiogenes arsenatis]|uniref:chemotaxis protein CheW n=1 Tax=Chrysiogenes arsenatis TaxID=309797 RepID=UPI0004116FE5|nr:chemotaxis protein CheW [Chrysiogenes arsenatis]